MRYDYEDMGSELARKVLDSLPHLSYAERIRLASSILLAHYDTNHSEGETTMVVQTDEHEYTIKVTREDL